MPAPGTLDQQRGAATLEFALVVPLLMLLVLAVLQFGLWYHAQGVVLAAAQEAARVTAAEDGTPTAGRARARELLEVGLGQDVGNATVTVTRDARLARATITASLRPLLPFTGALRLRAEGRSFAEHFRPAGSPP
jgi:Flp pilus assembly protein TadG